MATETHSSPRAHGHSSGAVLLNVVTPLPTGTVQAGVDVVVRVRGERHD
jgi:hypothetical protein